MNVNRNSDLLLSLPVVDSPRLDSELSSIANTVARRNLYVMTSSVDGFLQNESKSLLILNKLDGIVSRMQSYRAGQIRDIMEDPEINSEWESAVKESSVEFLSNLGELKRRFPYVYNKIVINLHRELEQSPFSLDSYAISSDEIDLVLGDVEKEASKNNITDENEILEMESESFLLKRAECHIISRLKDGNLNFYSIVKVLGAEIRMQKEYSLDSADSELNDSPAGLVLSKPVSCGSNFSLSGLWQRMTGCTPVTTGSSRSSSCKISPVNF